MYWVVRGLSGQKVLFWAIQPTHCHSCRLEVAVTQTSSTSRFPSSLASLLLIHSSVLYPLSPVVSSGYIRLMDSPRTQLRVTVPARRHLLLGSLQLCSVIPSLPLTLAVFSSLLLWKHSIQSANSPWLPRPEVVHPACGWGTLELFALTCLENQLWEGGWVGSSGIGTAFFHSSAGLSQHGARWCEWTKFTPGQKTCAIVQILL